MVKTLSITKARQQLPTLVDRVNKFSEEYIITVNGEPAAALVSVKRFELILKDRKT